MKTCLFFMLPSHNNIHKKFTLIIRNVSSSVNSSHTTFPLHSTFHLTSLFQFLRLKFKWGEKIKKNKNKFYSSLSGYISRYIIHERKKSNNHHVATLLHKKRQYRQILIYRSTMYARSVGRSVGRPAGWLSTDSPIYTFICLSTHTRIYANIVP